VLLLLLALLLLLLTLPLTEQFVCRGKPNGRDPVHKAPAVHM